MIGSGFSGLSAATYLAKAGCDVTVLEKNESSGGRARNFVAKGFTFDMGPSWYWMPGVFENYFSYFGKKVSDYYTLKRLDPSYRIYWNDGPMDIPADFSELQKLFESIEPGAATQLEAFLIEAKYKYEVGINKLVLKPGLSITEFLDWELAVGVFKLDVFTSMKKHVQKYFKHPKLVQWMEFPVLFLGALASQIPALYSLMNYADIKLGTWYPQGGMFKIAEGMESLAKENGVHFHFNSAVQSIKMIEGNVTGVEIQQNEKMIFMEADVLVGSGDYHHMETLLPEKSRSYSKNYWNKRMMAPSCLLYYVGLKKKLKGILHHSLFFDVDFNEHGKEIYDDPKWPEEPLFYVCTPSVTDETVAPAGCENLFFLIPVAAGLEGDSEILRKKYFDKIVTRFEIQTGEKINGDIIYYRSYSISDFKKDYNAFKGNAYGLANTLMQTALLKPSMKSKKVKNLFYTGQLTVPGPGVPPAIISGQVAAKQVLKCLEKRNLN